MDATGEDRSNSVGKTTTPPVVAPPPGDALVPLGPLLLLDDEANRANSDEGEGGSNIDRGRLTTSDDDSSETLCTAHTQEGNGINKNKSANTTHQRDRRRQCERGQISAEKKNKARNSLFLIRGRFFTARFQSDSREVEKTRSLQFLLF